MQRVSSDSGIHAVGEVPFGTHLCQFYLDSAETLGTILELSGHEVSIAHDGEEDRHRGQEAGFHHHLVKPVDPGVLQALLARPAGGAELAH